MSNHTQSSPASGRIELAKARQALYRRIRAYFDERHFIEVETPLISSAASTEPHLASIEATPWCGAPSGHLITSPEYPMKRLLAEWGEPIYQISKCFRALELSARHNPEFSMLEWYRPGVPLAQIERDLIGLIEKLTTKPLQLQRLSYAQAFEQLTGLNPHTLTCEQAQHYAQQTKLSAPSHLDRLGWIDLIFSVCVEPNLPSLRAVNSDHKTQQNALQPLHCTLLHGFLPEQASLAQTQVNSEGVEVALRFELYIGGLEIANAASELTDAAEQLRRFEADNRTRGTLGLPAMPIDHHLIAAMASLPPCAGIAVGLDRLLMVLEDCDHIEQVLLFGADKA